MKPTKHELHHIDAAIRVCRKASAQITHARTYLAQHCNVAKVGNAALFYMLSKAADKPEPFVWLVNEIRGMP